LRGFPIDESSIPSKNTSQNFGRFFERFLDLLKPLKKPLKILRGINLSNFLDILKVFCRCFDDVFGRF
jgi:hypothetical protein